MRRIIKILAVAAAMTFIFASCDNDDDYGFGRKIIISNIKNLPSDAATIKASLHHSGYSMSLVSADIVRGSATIELPHISPGYLVRLRGGALEDAILSDRNAKMGSISFDVYDSSGWFLCSMTLKNDVARAELLYLDRACTVTLTENSGHFGEVYHTRTINLNLDAGYNWVQHTPRDDKSSGIVDGIPAGAEWVCIVFPG